MSTVHKCIAKRRTTNPRAAAVLEAFERMLATPERDTYDATETFDHLLPTLSVRGWSDDALRAVLRALVMNCPDEDLETFEQWASKQVAWVKEWEVHCRYERLTGEELPSGVDLHALMRAMAGDDGEPVLINGSASVGTH